MHGIKRRSGRSTNRQSRGSGHDAIEAAEDDARPVRGVKAPPCKVLLLGKSGQVGWELERCLATVCEVVALDHQGMDLANPDSIRKTVREIRPSLIINAAAYTAVDKAEAEAELAMAINGIAPGILAEEAKRLGAALIHYSTDYVFDGTKRSPYTEDDEPHPLNVYGKTKLAGELAIQAVGAPYLILRTSWVYGARGKNFLLTILRLAQEKKELRIVDDQIGAPTWSRFIAQATAQILGQILYAPDGKAAPHWTDISRTLRCRSSPYVTGVYHLSCGGETSWYGFAQAAMEKLRHTSAANRPMPQFSPIPSAGYATAAARPAYSILSNTKLTDTFAIALPNWAHGLELVLLDLKS
ncbi:MAG: dTDP-4-dehydrorhamnose reductase [Gammaproteobacteria bacterium]|nr:dTDP-4-dehydrorhamnose reductase [Gammaproteobacteria bacterium]